MYIRIVTFTLDAESAGTYRDRAERLAPAFREWPGLAAKIWLADAGTATYGGSYDVARGRFTLPPEHAAVLADDRSPAFLAGGAVITTGWFGGVDRLATAFRTGAGIPWDQQHPGVFDGTERFFAPGYAALLTSAWIPALGGVAKALRAGGSALDVGCGHGTAAILLAAAYPAATVTGYDAHPASVDVARKRAAAGVADRVRFEVADAAGYPGGGHDVVCLLDTLHDLGDPGAAAARAHRALRPNGSVLVVEPQAADDLAANLANPMAALSYAASTFQCTPASLAQPGGAVWGAQAGERLVRTVLEAAGFRDVRRLADTPANRRRH